VHQQLTTAEIRKQRIPNSAQIDLVDALRQMTGADVGERDDARCDSHLLAPKISDDFGARAPAALMRRAPETSNPILRQRGSTARRDLSRRELRPVKPEIQSA
jgi:hypothetical protein